MAKLETLKIYGAPWGTFEQASVDLAKILRRLGRPPAQLEATIVDGIQHEPGALIYDRLDIVDDEVQTVAGYRWLLKRAGVPANDDHLDYIAKLSDLLEQREAAGVEV